MVAFFIIYIQNGIARSHASSIFNFLFKQILILFSTVAAQIYIPTKGTQGFPFSSTSSPTLFISGPFDDSHSKRYETMSHSGFDLRFPDDG